MSTEKLLTIEPQVLSFPFELHQLASCSIRLSNNTQSHVAYKVMATSRGKYDVKHNVGTVLPRSTLDITVTMQRQTEAPPTMKCTDKFLIQSAVASPEATIDDIRRLFMTARHRIQKCKLEVVYILPPQVPPAVPDGLVTAGHDRNGNNGGSVILRWIIIGLFGLIIWYLIQMAMPLIWSVVIFMMMLVMKMVNKMASDSIEDWIVKALCYAFGYLFLGRR
ncbi:unnamed protein product [Fraxinus pennsylvanica]|uniref:MSP domain-containing protein n=1 Tax=Fraxinus pennsylvanica TaxID=56036 RepID=A0AAD2E1P1_9LAMI|nr:unnamed protein product [Fraxinus pennsylvanica]